MDSLYIRYDREELTDPSTIAPGSAVETWTQSVQWNRVMDRWGVTVEAMETESEDSSGNKINSSTFAAARFWMKITQKLSSSLEYQHAFDGPDNNQTTLGAQYQVLPSLSLELKGTDGSRGESAQLGAIWNRGDQRLYLSRRLADDQAGKKTSTILGAEAPLGRNTKVYSEYQWEDTGSEDRTISLVGIQQQWEIGEGFKLVASGELSDVDSDSSNMSRSALAVGASYSNGEGFLWSSRGEIRFEDGTQDRMQYLTVNQVDWKFTLDWTLLGKYRYSKTEDDDTNETESRFDERSIGFAFRPVWTDRFNGLGRYTRLLDQRPASLGGPDRTQHTMEVLSVEGLWDVTRRVELFSKFAARRLEEDFPDLPSVETKTFLVIERTNLRIWRKIDFGVEYRILAQDETDDMLQGWLTEVTWELVKHFRVGAGYNFTDFSDDEFAVNDYSVHGWFFRVQGRY